MFTLYIYIHIYIYIYILYSTYVYICIYTAEHTLALHTDIRIILFNVSVRETLLYNADFFCFFFLRVLLGLRSSKHHFDGEVYTDCISARAPYTPQLHACIRTAFVFAAKAAISCSFRKQGETPSFPNIKRHSAPAPPAHGGSRNSARVCWCTYSTSNHKK